MINKNDFAKNIIIRNLSKKENELLRQLKKEFNVSYNNIAVMKASRLYIERGTEIKKLQRQLVHKEVENAALLDQLSSLQAKVAEYFAFVDHSVKGEKERRGELEQISSQSSQRNRKKNYSNSSKLTVIDD